jgi:hypothetical protein
VLNSNFTAPQAHCAMYFFGMPFPLSVDLAPSRRALAFIASSGVRALAWRMPDFGP